MRQGTILTLSAAALALAGCGHKTETTTTNDTTMTVADNMTTDNDMMASTNNSAMDAAPASAGQTFANAAAASDAFEIATSELAAASAKSDAVKKFALKMISAHTESTQKLKAAAGSASPAITPDATLNADQQKTLADLKALNGADFDTAYIAAQTDGHQKTLDALKAYSATGDVPQLKTFATALVPTVTAHLNMAKGLKG